MSKQILKEDYEEIVKYVSTKSGFSIHKVRVILTSYSKTLKLALNNGLTVNIPKLLQITFRSKRGVIYKNLEFNFSDQVRNVSYDTEYPQNEVKLVISAYLYRLRKLAEQGYRVNIKSIGYITPSQEEDGTIKVGIRISPVLEKPEIAEFLLVDKQGNIFMDELKSDEIRFKIDLAEDFVTPKKLKFEDSRNFELEFIDI